MKLKVTVNDQGNKLTLTCTGEIIRGTESEYLFDLITKRSNENIVVDLGSVARIDEDGVVMFVLCRRLLSSASKKLFLQNPSDCVRKALKHSQVEDFFNILQKQFHPQKARYKSVS